MVQEAAFLGSSQDPALKVYPTEKIHWCNPITKPKQEIDTSSRKETGNGGFVKKNATFHSKVP